MASSTAMPVCRPAGARHTHTAVAEGTREETGVATHAGCVQHPGRARERDGKLVPTAIGWMIGVVHAEIVVVHHQKREIRHTGIIAHSAAVG